MKTKMRSLTALVLALLLCAFAFVACDSGKTWTEDQLKAELVDSEGEMSGTFTVTQGTSEDVEAFTYVVTDINADDINSKSQMREVVKTLLTDPYDLTYGELKTAMAFSAVMDVAGIFYQEGEDFDADVYVDELLDIMIDGTSRTYDGWSISATIDQAADSITVKAVKN